MWALFEGTRTFHYFVSILVCSTVNCLNAKKIQATLCSAPSTPILMTNKNGSTSVTMVIKGKQTDFMGEWQMPSPLSLPEGSSSVERPPPRHLPLVLQLVVQKALIKGPKRESVRAGMSR